MSLVLTVVATLALWFAVRALGGYLRFRRLELAIPGPPSLPLLGNLLDWVRSGEADRLRLLTTPWAEPGGLTRFTLGPKLLVFVSDPEHVATVLKDQRFADKPSFFYSFLERVSGAGLLTLNGGCWRRHRAAVRPAFHPAVLDDYVDVFADEAARLVERLRVVLKGSLESGVSGAVSREQTLSPRVVPSRGGHVGDAETGGVVEGPVQARQSPELEMGGAFSSDGGEKCGGVLVNSDQLLRELSRALARASMRTIMASDILDEDKPLLEEVVSTVGQCIRDVNVRTFQPWLWPDAAFALSTIGKRLRRFHSVTNQFGRRVLSRIRSCPRQDGLHRDACRRTFTEIMVESKTDGLPTFTDDEILGEGHTLFGASVETSVATLGFVLKVLSMRPVIQDRIHAELRSVFDGAPRPLTAADVHRLPYMECVIKETLRMLPSFPLVARSVHQDTQLAGKTIPANSVVVVNIFGLHRDPRHFPNPLQFAPERFEGAPVVTPLPPPSSADQSPSLAWTRQPYSYLPFSAGARSCIGQHYAMVAIKAMLAAILGAYRVEAGDDNISDPAELPLTFYLSLHIVGGVRIRLAPRS